MSVVVSPEATEHNVGSRLASAGSWQAPHSRGAKRKAPENSANSLSVTFESLTAACDGLMSPLDLPQHPIANRILTRFTQPLVELSRRAQRVAGYIEARLIEQIKELRAELRIESLCDCGVLKHR